MDNQLVFWGTLAGILSLFIGAMALLRDAFNITLPLPPFLSDPKRHEQWVHWLSDRRIQSTILIALIVLSLTLLSSRIRGLEGQVTALNSTQAALQRANDVFLSQFLNSVATQTQQAQLLSDYETLLLQEGIKLATPTRSPTIIATRWEMLPTTQVP